MFLRVFSPNFFPTGSPARTKLSLIPSCPPRMSQVLHSQPGLSLPTPVDHATAMTHNVIDPAAAAGAAAGAWPDVAHNAVLVPPVLDRTESRRDPR